LGGGGGVAMRGTGIRNSDDSEILAIENGAAFL